MHHVVFIVPTLMRRTFAVLVMATLGKGGDVVSVMTRLQQELGLVPKRIQVDNGSEFISKALDRWAYDQ